MFERADAHLLGSKTLCGGLSMCTLSQHRRRVQSCIGSARLRKRARLPQPHQAAAIRETHRGSRYLTIGHSLPALKFTRAGEQLAERVVQDVRSAAMPVEYLQRISGGPDKRNVLAVFLGPPNIVQ